MDEQLEYRQQSIDSERRELEAARGVVTDPDRQALLDEAEAELNAAQEALDAAKAAHKNGNDDLARAKLRESMDHSARAIMLIREALAE